MTYFLSDRQQVLLQHTCDLWSVSQATDVETRMGGEPVYTPADFGVPCHFEKRASVENPRAAGRVEGDIQGTRDQIHLPETVPIEAGWAIVNRTLDFDGNPAVEYGQVWIVQGRPRTIPRVGNRDAGKKIAEAVLSHRAPPGVVV
jgi:hypothetical protein